jgi:S-DNA-T family DNA segregation ATPase FtsK/SpoIIIE
MRRRLRLPSENEVEAEGSNDLLGPSIDIPEVVVVPRRAAEPARPPFPLMGSLAPLGVAAVVWVVLQSPLALVFALLSPVMAVASLVDARLSGRRAKRRLDAEVASRRRAFTRRVHSLHAREIESLNRLAPSAGVLLDRSVNPFTAISAAEAKVNLGSGVVRSALRVDGGIDDDDEVARRMRSEALTMTGAPVIAPSPVRIAVVGTGPLVHSLARGYAVQLAASISPDAVDFAAGAARSRETFSHWGWVSVLPHRGVEPVQLGPGDDTRRTPAGVFVVVADSLDDVPAEATVVVTVDSAAAAAVLRHPVVDTPLALDGEYVSVVQVEAFGRRLRRQVSSIRAQYELPATVSSVELEAMAEARDAVANPDDRGRLRAAIGVSEIGEVFSLDLVEQGPHAVVAGTTGSGKSELLVTWVSSLARAYDSSLFTVLLVDFKGGAAFDALTGLEQCVGLITDLDPGGAERALSSLRAEIRWREKVLRQVGARDISDSRTSGQLARLVIVVDEFAAMLSEFPELHDVFADIAARGRSLGMHLVLCTQRPAGVVRDSLLANCELRLSLRVNNAADSVAIVGTAVAAALAPELRGRCAVAVGGRAPVVVQVARTDEAEITARSEPTGRGVRAPWLPALPSELWLDDVVRPPTGVLLGLLDLPDEQRQPPAVYDPAQQGPLLALGSPGSGKSTLLATIGRQADGVIVVGTGIEKAWDTVRDIVALCHERRQATTTSPPLIVLFDDLDSAVRRFDPEYQSELISDLGLILRDGPQCGIVLVASAHRLGAPLTALAPLFAERIHFRFSSRQEYIVAEGAAGDHDPRLAPGAAHWRGTRLQVARVPHLRSPRSGSLDAEDRGEGRGPAPRRLLVVSARPGVYFEHASALVPRGVSLLDIADRDALSAYSGKSDEPVWLIGSPDSWTSAWSTFARLRSAVPVFFDGCSLGDFRSLSRRRDLPPPVEAGRISRWLLSPDGSISRFELPELSDSEAGGSKRIS